jgi:urocanate hydratase
LALDPPSHAAFDVVARVARCYAALSQSSAADPESCLSGRFLYIGELDDAGRAYLVAASICGAATLAAVADRDAQMQALRDGVADFLVNSLDEALRILKNQLRKRESVAVCVAQAPEAMEREMNERGVAPDLMRREVPFASHREAMLIQEREQDETDLGKIPAVVTWRAGSGLPKDLAALDAVALACLDPDEWKSKRWLRLAPRYLGRMAQGLHLLETHREFDARFTKRVREAIDRGEIAFALEICSYINGMPDQFRFDPRDQ